MNTLFCRHNRFTADCPICSKGTVLDPSGPERAPARGRTRSGTPAKGRSTGSGGARSAGGGAFRGPYAAAGPYERDGARHEVRLERVPGGLRLAEWAAGALSRSAPVLAAADLPGLIEQAGEREVLRPAEHEALVAALTEPPAEPAAGTGGPPHGASRGRSGDMQDELRVERAGRPGTVRVARWMLRPGDGWVLVEAPPMLPVARYAQALREAARRGVLGPG